jgi:Na+/glutamate symporter
MNKQEILNKIDNKQATIGDLLNYYEIKNEEQLEFALAEKLKQVNQSGDFLNSAFKFIYETRKKETYNPIEETYVFYAMVLQGLYGIDSDEIKILAATIGAFKTVMLLEIILENKNEVLFFKKMYKQYIEKIENVYLKLNDILASVNKILTDFDPKQLEGFSEDLKKAIGNLNIE